MKRPLSGLAINIGKQDDFDAWKRAFEEFFPELNVQHCDDERLDPCSVHYALVFAPAAGLLASFPNLRLIQSAGAGVDHILRDPSHPKDIPIVRMVSRETNERMADYVTMWSLAHVRGLPRLLDAQRDRRWLGHLTGRLARETCVGILGLGEIGSAVAAGLAAHGFQVLGWARSAKDRGGIATYTGAQGLDHVLARSDILVNLLPNTPDTFRLIDEQLLAKLPSGSMLVNVGRGAHLVTSAVVSALDRGHLDCAVLDVFDEEPLPRDNPIWSHPRIFVTPHIASTVSVTTIAQQTSDNIRCWMRGEVLPHLYEPSRGY